MFNDREVRCDTYDLNMAAQRAMNIKLMIKNTSASFRFSRRTANQP